LFGYITVQKPELKIKEYDLYQSAYCGLCKELGRRFGPLSRMFLSYDFVFLALLIETANDDAFSICPGRCMLNPMKRKPILKDSSGIAYSAVMSVLFLHYKILDNIRDNPFFRRWKWYFLYMLTYPAFRRAKREYPRQNSQIGEYMENVRKLENNHCAVLDEPAVLFGEILQKIGTEPIGDPAAKRIAGEILKNMGRWIYILDAFEDLAEDEQNKAYNPLFYRFEKSDGEKIYAFRNRIEGEVGFTLTQSLAAAGSAFALLENRNFNPVLHNIIYFGLRAKQQSIISGKGDRTENGSV
jgi:hypothetical protein